MKALFLLGLISLSFNVFASEARKLAIPADWNLINCKQLENGGMSFWKQNYPNANLEIFAIEHQAGITYEITIDGEWRASCRFVSVQNLSR